MSDLSFRAVGAPAGFTYIGFGSNTATPRPSGIGAAWWFGTGTPVNAVPGDAVANASTGAVTVVTAAPAVGTPLAWWDLRQYDGSGTLPPRQGTLGTNMTFSSSGVTNTPGSDVALYGGPSYATIPDDPALDVTSGNVLTVIIIQKSAQYAGGKSRFIASHRLAGGATDKGWVILRLGSPSPYNLQLIAQDGTNSQTLTLDDTNDLSGFIPIATVIKPSGTHRLTSAAQTVTAASTLTGDLATTARLVLGLNIDNPASQSGQNHTAYPTYYRGVLIYNTELTQQNIVDYATAAGAGAT